MNKHRITLIFLLLASLSLAAITAYYSPGNFGNGFTAAGSMIFLSVVTLYFLWRWAGGGKTLAWMMILAFVLRLAVGTVSAVLIPIAGYDQPEQHAGYLFFDAWTRDSDAWKLAVSADPLWAAFQNEIVTDQYGGLLTISAVIYRVFSPDAHRPLLIIILTGWIAAMGVAAFYKGIKSRWGTGVANPATWILALYPESIVLGSSQMREPFLIGLSALIFWGVLEWQSGWRKAALGIGLGALGLFVISSKVAIPVLGVFLIWFTIERIPSIKNQVVRWVIWGVLALAGIYMAYKGWHWMTKVMRWDLAQTIHNSGVIQKRLKEIIGELETPFIVLYGVVRPLPPAVLTDPDTVPFWRTMWMVRSLGWYALAPLLAYGTMAIWKVKDRLEKRLWILVMSITWIWTLVASARAGADQTDNFRYRTILIAWMALLAGWAWYRARVSHDPWLWRWFTVEGIFLVMVTVWYANRYWNIGPSLSFWVIIVIILALSALVLGGGWAHDVLTRKRQAI